MNYASTIFLRLVIIGLATLVTLFAIFLLPQVIVYAGEDYGMTIALSAGIGIYAAALPFFLALYQGWRLLGLIEKNKTFTPASVKALNLIKWSAIITAMLFAGSLPLFYASAKSEDAPGVMVIGLALASAPLVVGIFAGLMQRLLQSAVDLKKENDLTV